MCKKILYSSTDILEYSACKYAPVSVFPSPVFPDAESEQTEERTGQGGDGGRSSPRPQGNMKKIPFLRQGEGVRILFCGLPEQEAASHHKICRKQPKPQLVKLGFRLTTMADQLPPLQMPLGWPATAPALPQLNAVVPPANAQATAPNVGPVMPLPAGAQEVAAVAPMPYVSPAAR